VSVQAGDEGTCPCGNPHLNQIINKIFKGGIIAVKKLALALMVLLLTAGGTSWASTVGFEKGKTTLGPTIGYGWDLGFGAQGEYGVTDKIGLGGDFAYTSFTDKFGWGYGAWYEWKYTLIGILAAGSYHFTPGKAFDPFVKAGLGFFHWSASYKDSYGYSSSSVWTAGYTSGMGFTGQIGARYFFSPSVAGRASIGWPFYFGVGIDFKF
jgi:hypothetical protein